MTRRFKVHFRNGVLVPDEKVELPEQQAFTVTLDEGFPDDPPPEGGVGLADWFSQHRIKIDPETARAIAEDPEFDIENS